MAPNTPLSPPPYLHNLSYQCSRLRMPSKTKRRTEWELLLLQWLPLRLWLQTQPLQLPHSSVPSVASLGTLLSAALSLKMPARRPRRSAPTRKIDVLSTRVRLMLPKKRRLLLSLQERQVFVFLALPAPSLMPGMQTLGPLLI